MSEKKFTSLNDIEEKSVEINFYREWRKLATSLDGYKILAEMGYEGRDWQVFWREKRYAVTKETGWNLNLAEALLLLFLIHQRSKFLSGGENYKLINSILLKIAELTDSDYVSDEETDKAWVNERNRKDIVANHPKIVNWDEFKDSEK